ncbi:MAG: alpha-galactosidase [Bacteroidota bacterium]
MQMIFRTTLFLLSLLTASMAQAELIHIETRSTSLIFAVKNNKVHQIHYGARVETEDGMDQLPLFFEEIYPSFGNGSSDEVALVVTHHDGSMATDLYYVSHEQSADVEKSTTVIVLKDEKHAFFVELHFVAYQEENVIEQWTVLKNQEEGSVRLLQFASAAMGFKAESYYLTHFHGSWAKEMILVEEKLGNGIKSLETKRGVRTTEYENPSFVLSLSQKASDHQGEVVMGALAWTGNYRLSFQINDRENCQLTAGINPFASEYSLDKQGEFRTPRMVLSHSTEGKNKASIQLHRWARKYNLRKSSQPLPVVLNSWEGAYFTFDDATIKSMMDGAAEMGVEVFVLDDGWFGNKYPRNSDQAGLGDWQVNKSKLPKGISDLIDHAETKGLRFGIWVEPEMVNPKSELADNHPDWIVQRGNDRAYLLERNQLLLDLSNPEVQDFVFDVVDGLLSKHPRIAYIKWDANRHIQNFGSTYLDKSKQSHLWIAYAKGLEDVLRRLTEKYPNTIFQACSSGGGRLDYGILKYSHEFWASDNTDPHERLFIQWGTNHIYPPKAMGAHVTKSPNHQTHRETTLKFRFDIAMGGRLGLELSPDDFSAPDLAYIKKGVASYKGIRDIVQEGDLYRLLSPYDEDGYAAINYVSQDKAKAVLMVYSHEMHRRSERNLVKMKGLDASAIYKLREMNREDKGSPHPLEGQSISGDVLMTIGMKVDLKQPLSSAVFLLERVKP